jgi:hypothetical protein
VVGGVDGRDARLCAAQSNKSQILADFVAEWTDTQLLPLQIQAECWTLYFDGSVMKTGAGAGLLFISPLGECRMDLPGPTTSVGTGTDYSVGPWDYPACAARHLMA